MLENLRIELVNMAKKAEREGLCKHKSGNFSIKDKETGYVLVTPSGISREVLEPKDICIIDINGNIIEKDESVKPTSETSMHLTAYREREDVYSVAHTHAKYATAFAVAGLEIGPIVFEANIFGGRAVLAPYGRPTTPQLAETIVEKLKVSDAILLEKHGVLTVGNSSEDALQKMLYVEDTAEIYYIAKVLRGGEVKEIPQEELDAVEGA